jgi:hypothetical protein
VVIISQVISYNKGERNFKRLLFDTDTTKISSITIKTKLAKQELELVKDGKDWNVSDKGKTYKVEKSTIRSMIMEIYNMRAERLAAIDKSEWNTFQVTDSLATHVKVKQGNKVVADFLVGKFSYSQNPQKFNTFIRLSKENEVYAVDGFLAMTFSKQLNDVRNKALVSLSSAQITKLSFKYPADSSFELVKGKNGWTINGQEADSAKAAGYINNLAYISGNEFVSDSIKSGLRIYSLKIEGNNFSPVEISANTADTTNKYIITSNINPDGRFSGISSDLTNRIFVSKKRFVKSL